METRAHHVLIGLFTLVAVSAALLFSLWLAKSSEGEFSEYRVIFNDAVTGLSVGSSVRYNGIRIGDVTDLRLDPEDPRRVLARIRVAAGTPIKQDTRAKLSVAGVTGSSSLQLSAGTPQSPPLTAARKGELPTIVADRSPFSRLLANGEDLMTGVSQALIGINRVLSPENAERFSQTLDNLQQATGAIADQRDELRDVLHQLSVASQQASATLEQSTQLMRNANSLLDAHGNSILANADRTLASLQRSSASLDRMLEGNRDAVDGSLRGLNELGPTLRELRQTLTSLRTVSDRLHQSPVDYLLGREQAEGFQP
jgi:phospholipid/cholesterol/gamma-HCH transport system substrate-binding protein